MNDLERRKFQLHAETADYERRIGTAERYVKRAFEFFETPYVSFSGGKDSTVLIHLVTQRCGFDDVDVYHFDWGLRNVPGTNDHVRMLVDAMGGTLFQRSSEKVQDPSRFANDEHHGIAGLLCHERLLREERGWTAGLLGIRAEESGKRRDKYSGTPPLDRTGERVSIAPIHHLTTMDVWAYIVENEIPYHAVYDEQGKILGGMDKRGNRLVTIYDHEFSNYGSESISQFVYPSETNELKEIEQSECDPQRRR